jgi:hypothetical protein
MESVPKNQFNNGIDFSQGIKNMVSMAGGSFIVLTIRALMFGLFLLAHLPGVCFVAFRTVHAHSY